MLSIAECVLARWCCQANHLPFTAWGDACTTLLSSYVSTAQYNSYNTFTLLTQQQYANTTFWVHINIISYHTSNNHDAVFPYCCSFKKVKVKVLCELYRAVGTSCWHVNTVAKQCGSWQVASRQCQGNTHYVCTVCGLPALSAGKASILTVNTVVKLSHACLDVVVYCCLYSCVLAMPTV